MLKIRYQTADNQVTGWCGDDSQFGGLTARTGETCVEWDIAIPTAPLSACFVDLAKKTIAVDQAVLNAINAPQKRVDDAKTQLNAADFDAAKKSIEAAATVADLKPTLALLAELVGRLAEAQGLEPATPTAVTP